MTVASNLNIKRWNGNSATVDFDFAFNAVKAEYLEVTRTDALGVDTLLTYAVDYGVTLNPDGSGTVNYPVAGDPLPPGEKLTARRVLPLKQLTDLINQGGFFPEVHEAAFDNLAMQIQQLAEELERALKISVSSELTNLAIPNPPPDRTIVGNAAGDGYDAGPTVDEISGAQGYSLAAKGYRDEAVAAAANLPNATTAGPSQYLKSNADATGWDYKSAADFKVDMAGAAQAANWQGAQRGQVAALPATVGAITLDLAAANNFDGTLTGSITLTNPTNIVAGQGGVIRIVNGATPYVIAYGSYWKAQSGNLPALTPTAGSVDLLAYYVESPTKILVAKIGDTR